MTPTKLLIGQILAVLAIMMLGIWTATQYAAAKLAYQPELGSPWFILLGTPVCHPWSIFRWWFSFDAYAPVIFDEAGGIAATGGLMGCAAAIFGSVWRARQPGNVTTYGSARWATHKDIRDAGLLVDDGVAIGRVGRHDLRHDGPEHVMAFAPTRSGKGVGLVVPTLLSWTGSTVVHDIKGENWQLTAGWRSRFSHCLLFNPTDVRSARYNPLLEVRRGINEVRDVQNIADILVDPEGALERRNHWEKTSHALLIGAILHVLYAEEEKTLARVATFLSDPQRSFAATLRRMMATNHVGTADAPLVHPVVASAARELLNKSENERSGVLSTAMSFLGLYRDPTVAAVTAASDWRIADLVEARHPVSLYLVVPPSDISRTKPLVRLILNQIGRRLTEELHAPGGGGETGNRRHRLLMMLDEFPALGRLDFFETSRGLVTALCRPLESLGSFKETDEMMKHSEEFKQEAVRIALTSGLPRERVASDLGVGKSTLNKWVSHYRPSGLVSAPQADLARENERLRLENRVLREEREILKKATQFFASQRP